jgi:hypothetical protein
MIKLLISVAERVIDGDRSAVVFTGMNGYTVACNDGHRLLMRDIILKTYPPPRVTRDSPGPNRRAQRCSSAAQMRQAFFGGIMRGEVL